MGPDKISSLVGIVPVDDPSRLPDDLGDVGPQFLKGSSSPIGTPVKVVEFSERTVKMVRQPASQSRLSDSANPHDVHAHESTFTSYLLRMLFISGSTFSRDAWEASKNCSNASRVSLFDGLGRIGKAIQVAR